jgi:hypothetical protein
MLVRFTKGPPAARTDALTCQRPNGSLLNHAMTRQGVLPREAVHFVIETTLGWSDGLFGRVREGATIAELLPNPKASHARPSRLHKTDTTHVRLLQGHVLAECLQAEQWSGPSAASDFLRNLAKACRPHGVPPPELTPPQLERLRIALREFGAGWRPLVPDAEIERTFAP